MAKHLVDGMPLNPVVGDVYFDTTTGTIKVPGANTVHEFGAGEQNTPWQPKWYGYVNEATATQVVPSVKKGGTGIITVRLLRTGVYRILCSGFTAADAVPIAIGGAYNTTAVDSSILPASVTVVRNGSYIDIHRMNSSGAYQNGFFWLLIL